MRRSPAPPFPSGPSGTPSGCPVQGRCSRSNFFQPGVYIFETIFAQARLKLDARATSYVLADLLRLYRLNVSDPANPLLVGSFISQASVEHMTLDGNHLYLYVPRYEKGLIITELTDPAGRYVLDLPAGTYDILARKAGYLTAVVPSVVVVTGTNILDLALDSPVARVRPGSMRACAVPGGAVTQTLSVANLGSAPLVFGIAETTATLPLEGGAALLSDVPWVSESITRGVVPAGGALDLDIVFSARPPYDVVGERYMAALVVAQNDPLIAGAVDVPVALVVEMPCRRAIYLPVMSKGAVP